jgi:hypothetical protein
MLSDRAFAGFGLAAIAAAGLVATPALSAIGSVISSAPDRATALSALVGRFTPATGEPALLARYARLSDEARSNFRFTPALARSENRAVTLVVRAAPAGSVVPAARDAATPITITPVSYRLGAAVGYAAFAAPPPAVTAAPAPLLRDRVDIAALPTARRPVETAARRPSRFGADMRLDNRSLPGASERALDPERAYSVDVTGSYRLSRNLDVTAGVRLQRENDRLQPLTDDRRDSQAVYVGTQFRF